MRFRALGFSSKVVSVLTDVKQIPREGLTFAAPPPLSLTLGVSCPFHSPSCPPSPPSPPSEPSVRAACSGVTVVASYLRPGRSRQGPGRAVIGWLMQRSQLNITFRVPPLALVFSSLFPSGNLIRRGLMNSSRHLRADGTCTHSCAGWHTHATSQVVRRFVPLSSV